jgi:dihydrofolate reductase
MGKLVSFMHTSLDGFVATLNGEIDWIIVDEEIFEYSGNRITYADTGLYGRITFELMESYWPTAADNPAATKHDIDHSAWYKKAPKVVLSRTMHGENLANTTIISDNVPAQISKLKQETEKEIVMFGSPGATQSLMAKNLVDEIWIFINPILLGEGIPFFKNIKKKIKLSLLENHAFTNGVVCMHYNIKTDEDISKPQVF